MEPERKGYALTRNAITTKKGTLRYAKMQHPPDEIIRWVLHSSGRPIKLEPITD